MFCYQCGKPIPDNYRFCPACGAEMDPAITPAANDEIEVTPEEIAACRAEAILEEIDRAGLAAGNEVLDLPPITPDEDVPQSENAAAPAVEEPSQAAPQEQPAQEPEKAEKAKNPKGKKKRSAGKIIAAVIIGILLLFLLAELGLYLWLHRPQPELEEFDLNDYYHITYDGYDGYGTARLTVDKDAILEELTDIITVYPKTAEKNVDSAEQRDTRKLLKKIADLDAEIDADEAADLLADAMADDAELSDTADLSNGDKITLSWNISFSDDDLALIGNALGIEILAEDTDITVSGLTEITEFDPFEDLNVSYSGISPYITLTVSDSPEHLQYIIDPDEEYIRWNTEVSRDSVSYLAAGEEITIAVNWAGRYSGELENIDAYVQKYGARPTRTRITVTVPDTAYYIGTIDDVPSDLIKELQADIEARLAEEYKAFDFDVSFTLNYVGTIVSEGSSTTYANRIIVIDSVDYSGTVIDYRDTEPHEFSGTYYVTATAENAYVTLGDEYIYDANTRFDTQNQLYIKYSDIVVVFAESIPGNPSTEVFKFKPVGFSSIDDIITENFSMRDWISITATQGIDVPDVSIWSW